MKRTSVFVFAVIFAACIGCGVEQFVVEGELAEASTSGPGETTSEPGSGTQSDAEDTAPGDTTGIMDGSSSSTDAHEDDESETSDDECESDDCSSSGAEAEGSNDSVSADTEAEETEDTGA